MVHCRSVHNLPGIIVATILAVVAIAHCQVAIKPAIPVEDTRRKLFASGDAPVELANFRIHLRYTSSSPVPLAIGTSHLLNLPNGSHTLDLTHSRQGAAPALIRASIDGSPATVHELEVEAEGNLVSSDAALRMDSDFTIRLTFQSGSDGPLVARTTKRGIWKPGSKALFIRDGQLFYDVHGAGFITRKRKIDDNKPHHVVISCKEGVIDLWLDGRRMSKPVQLSNKDDPDHVFKIGLGAKGFTGELERGAVRDFAYWNQATVNHGAYDAKNPEVPDQKPTLEWSAPARRETFQGRGLPGMPVKLWLAPVKGLEIHESWAQPLDEIDHAAIIGSWSKRSLKEGKQIYQSLCITCHGTAEEPGSMPTSRKLHAEMLKNGADPYRFFQTVRNGYGLMPPMPQLSAEETYATIHYVREAIFKAQNPGQYTPVDKDYLDSLPRGAKPWKQAQENNRKQQARPYEEMDFGPSLNWTFQLNPGKRGAKPNFAYKGISVRLDEGPGGISKGREWAVYDQDTMRLACIYRGDFVDWKNIAFDGSHGTHTSIAGQPLFIMPDAPSWIHPTKQTWDDERITGRDNRRYGPLPKEWVRFKGLFHFANKAIISYQVGDASILEMPGLIPSGETGMAIRTLNISKSSHDLVARLAPDSPDLHIAIEAGDGINLGKRDGFSELRIPAANTPTRVLVAYSNSPIGKQLPEPASLDRFTKGGPCRFPETVTTSGSTGEESGPFALDVITIPHREENPWKSWMRIGGFDFFPGNPDRAAVCTWYGDVWLVDGVAGDLAELTWRRICTGLFQPLGIKIVDNRIHVLCRDQLARLHDLNGDEEIDFIECFNNDHQVTEHFHEFAMGLQTDPEGNFYYAKSARHARPGLVPHHGTLLKVSADGKKTEIIATGLRAANGICITPEQQIFVTDQEGDWCPKNRINLMKKGRFYGNMLGYHDVTDQSDAVMEEPLVWITNSFDRSPAEPVWIPGEADWGPLNEHLLNLSYGYGQAHIVNFEEVEGQLQGSVCALPMKRTPTGLIRGRFHPRNHHLYTAGMTAWATNCREDGGFYRIRPTGKPSYLPVKTRANKGRYTISFSDRLPSKGSFRVTTWDLQRSRRYGSAHHNQQQLDIESAIIEGNTLTLSIPRLQPTRGMEIVCDFEGGIHRVIHATIHQLLDTADE